MKTLLNIDKLNSGYGKVPILRDVTFNVQEGEVLAIIGPNGAGKSTLLKTISGLIKATGGTAVFDKKNLTGLPPHTVMKAGISYVPEGGRLFVNMTVRDNLLMGAYTDRSRLKTGILEEIFSLFPALEARQKQYARTLSGGEKQMLAIGRGLVCGPRLIMFDEPSLGIAPILVDSIYETLHKLKQKGLTVLLVEQNTNYALELADRAYVLENGSIVMEGTGKELIGSEHIRKSYMGL